MVKYIVYITINLCNGKFYIGVHKTNPDVFDGYIGDGIYRQQQATKDYPFHTAVRKYGYENFKRTTIKIFPNTEEGKKAAFALEETLVNETLLKSKQVYNCAIGGKGGNNEDSYKRVYMFDLNGNYLRSFKCSREAALYIDPESVESTRQAIKNKCRGITKSSLGYYWSYTKEFVGSTNNKWKPVAQYTLSGKFIRSFDSMTEASELLGLNSIDQAVTKRFQCGGYQWREYTGDNSDIAPLMNAKSKFGAFAIDMYSKDGTYLESFNSINECIEKFSNLDKSQIMRVLKKVIKSHKGYVFKFKDEDIVQSNQK